MLMVRLLRWFGVLAGLCACTSVFSADPATSNPLLSNVRPWCIGRLVFDRPVSSEISSQRYAYRGEQLLTTHEVPPDAYQAAIAAREQVMRTRLRANPVEMDRKTRHAWLEKAFSPVPDSRVFVFNEAAAKSVTLPFDTEGYLYANRTLVRTTGSIGADALDRVEGIYDDTFRCIRMRDNWVVPTEPGFCFDGGIVTGSSTYPEEVRQSFALMPGRPALLVIQSRNAVGDDREQSLSRTLPALRAKLDRLPGSHRLLREGKRSIAGMDAEEVLFELRDGAVTAYRFYLLAPGNAATLAQPHTAIEMLLGVAGQSDLPPAQATSPVDEARALQAWDTLLNGLHARPGAI
ncbi:T6SS immunity protein Tli4 family protein [Burkholderia cenocepacia]|uniref:T6SS immunity protein Tli4 family protein n=1 Tax=Burkholderia cenocepacia TaxID=95486 RepID=UPI002B2459BD|nr:T6SS immunity protein Tli4 family protein [Burkholderia cenocepacia]MEB2602681.1 T6SS immunity protein Tli4 family protein [Burkholderia cenocepacia]